MPYMGTVPPDSDIGVRLLAAVGNTAMATLSAILSETTITPNPEGLVVEPGRSRALTILTDRPGTLRLHVQFRDGLESGELEVRVNGAVRDVQLVRGEVWWNYSIEAPPMSANGADRGTTLYGATDSRRTPRDQ